VLSYSVILLNTDAHNPQIKKRMTKDDFVKNNRGINENADLPRELLSSIYDEITTNEIRMRGELEASMLRDPVAPGAAGLAGTLATVGRDMQREAYMLQSSSMANKTEVRRASAGVVSRVSD
jgi:brefeldin A-inhibited guanine nucleotide-exchange protein